MERATLDFFLSSLRKKEKLGFYFITNTNIRYFITKYLSVNMSTLRSVGIMMYIPTDLSVIAHIWQLTSNHYCKFPPSGSGIGCMHAFNVTQASFSQRSDSCLPFSAALPSKPHSDLAVHLQNPSNTGQSIAKYQVQAESYGLDKCFISLPQSNPN